MRSAVSGVTPRWPWMIWLKRGYETPIILREVGLRWFVGTNPCFDFESPAWILRERGREGRAIVVRAARDFVADALAEAIALASREEEVGAGRALGAESLE